MTHIHTYKITSRNPETITVFCQGCGKVDVLACATPEAHSQTKQILDLVKKEGHSTLADILKKQGDRAIQKLEDKMKEYES